MFQPSLRIAVVIPAYNEAGLVARCVASLRAQTYPEALYDVVVVADNCTDGTAAVARAAGASVLRHNRPDRRGKGQALRFAVDRLLALEPPVDAIAVVDADTVAEPDFLRTLARPLHRGADAVQGESLLSEAASREGTLRAAAFLLVNRVRPAGRAVLGLPCSLAGNGMLFSRRVLLAHPWEAFTCTEDLEYELCLRAAGVKPEFASGAIVHSPVAPDGRAADQQRLRWIGGKLHLARHWVPRFVLGAVREHRPDLLDAAFDLAVPPLGLFAAVAVIGTSVAALGASTAVLPVWSLAPWSLAIASIPLYVLVGLRAARAPRSAYQALTRAPYFVVSKLLQSRELLGFRSDVWHRARRPGENIEDTGVV